MDIGAYPQQERALGASTRQATLTEQLEHQKQNLETRLLEVATALEALKKNPELQQLFDAVAKVRY